MLNIKFVYKTVLFFSWKLLIDFVCWKWIVFFII